MIQKLLYTTLAMACVLSAYSQKKTCNDDNQNPTILTYSLGCNATNVPKKCCKDCNDYVVCYNSLVQIRIIGINTLRYDIKVDGVTSIFNEKVPDIFKDNKVTEQTESESLIGENESDSSLLGLKGRFLDKSQKAENFTELDVIFHRSITLNKKMAQLNQLNGWAKELKRVFLAECVDSNDILKKSTYMNGLNDKSVISTTDTYLQEYKEARFAFEQQKSTMLKDDKYKDNEALKIYFEEFDKLILKTNQTDYNKLANGLAEFYNMINLDILSYLSQPILVDGDALNVELTITKKELAEGDKEESIKCKLPTIYTCGGIKIDFSEGFFFSSLTNENYTLNNGQIANGNSSNLDYGIGGMMHIYKRNYSRLLTTAGSFGMFINQEQNIRYLAGVSLICGKQKRAVLSGGGAYGNIKILSASQKVGDTLSTGNVDDIKLDEVGRFGWFFSVTYNL